jgi:hypothetical protein
MMKKVGKFALQSELTFYNRDIAEKFLNWRETTITNSLNLLMCTCSHQ